MRESELKRMRRNKGAAYPDVFRGVQVHSTVTVPGDTNYQVLAQAPSYRYYFKQGKNIVVRGVTNDLARREREHIKQYGLGRIVQVGRQVTAGEGDVGITRTNKGRKR